ncbi:GGDEF domain-containing protein [Pelotomaculum isophthalicicum JI]|uniref:GGDEF domain-containing protein n=1 Tax=Pelotomaculum isophthalicicum JI TaxID=947010 RepID=A0A9X4H411_9FIRM|nr:GGDEF domain-containing protein [Pelotomaculum isophthalicicum]MDF9409990.1 GGDEF domain-containing protein [Pelotomaculum isophthalicicum JI]
MNSIPLSIDDHIIKNLPKRYLLAAILCFIGLGTDIPWLSNNAKEIFLLRGLMVAGALSCSFLSKYCKTRFSAEALTTVATLGLITNMAVIGLLEGTYLTGYMAAVYQTLVFIVVFIPMRTKIFIGLLAVVGLLWFWIFPVILSISPEPRLFLSHIFGYITYAFMTIAGNYIFFQVWAEKEKQRAHLEVQSQKLKDIANRDGLTGIYNYRYFQEKFPELVENAKNQSTPISLCLIDLDGFKSINDTFGHVIGNSVLEHVSQCLTSSIRTKDIVYRIGGDEFAISLPDVNSGHARQIIERFQSKLISTEPKENIPQVNCSIGIAEYCQQLPTAKAIIEAADRALYKAKKLTDNKVVVFSPGEI